MADKPTVQRVGYAVLGTMFLVTVAVATWQHTRERQAERGAPARGEKAGADAAAGDGTAAETPSRATDRARATFAERLAEAAVERTRHRVTYDPSYAPLAYPGGDVPDDRGVCADVIVRAYRAVGVDLQQAVHEDMRGHFRAYPQLWGLSGPDSNIDHRRVPNLRTFFSRHGEVLATSSDPADYLPGDVVTWALGGGLRHIGLVVRGRSAGGVRPLVVHNIGAGPKAEDVLFRWKMTGHYRYSAGPEPAGSR